MTRKEERIETLLYNAILSWYEDFKTLYDGLNDENFINKVCGSTGLSIEEYKNLMLLRLNNKY